MKQLKVLTISKPFLKKNVKHIQVENKLETIKSVIYFNSTEHFLQLLINLQINFHLMFISNTSHLHVSEWPCTVPYVYIVSGKVPNSHITRSNVLYWYPRPNKSIDFTIMRIKNTWNLTQRQGECKRTQTGHRLLDRC